MSKLTPAQTAALRAAVDGGDAYQAALEYHLARQRCSRGSPSRYAAITIHSLRRAGFVMCGGHGFDVEHATITDLGRDELPGSDPIVLRDFLELVSTKVPLDVIKGWTWDQRAEAERWAGLLHLKASDNPVRVPPVPEHVKPYRDNASRKPVQIGSFRV
jgi:hypothetical protein